MQQFLPFSDYQKCFQCLDMKRKWKQVVEAKQAINALEGISKGWRNHPYTRRWEGYENSLKEYFNVGLQHCKDLGINTKMIPYEIIGEIIRPPFFNDPEIHSFYRQLLIEKKKEWYAPMFKNPENDIKLSF